jgi:hypothetical protein
MPTTPENKLVIQRRYQATAKGRATKRAYNQSYAATAEGKAAQAASRKRQRVLYPERYVANTALNNAVRLGKIVRPDRCERCGWRGMPHGHHRWGYTPENRLRVEWLCRPCHRESHRGLDS